MLEDCRIEAPSLLTIPFFALFSIPDLQMLIDNGDARVHPENSILFQRGDNLTSLYVLLDGEVELSAMVQGQPCVLEVLGKNAILGDAAIFSGDASDLTARTRTPSLLLTVRKEALLALINRRFDLQRHILSVMSQKLRGQIKRIAELKLKTTAQRLGIYLLSLNNVAIGSAELALPYDKKRIAEELGMQPESLSRSLAKLARTGVEALPNNRIKIMDMAKLRHFCITDD